MTAAATALLRTVASVGVAASLFAASGPAFATEAAEPIRIALNDWTGQRITSVLMGTVLQTAGYRVAYVETSYMGQLDAMAAGEVDVGMEFWSIAGSEALDAAVAAGDVVNLGETGMIAREGWWYPSYVQAMCPGLPAWQALNDCAGLFAVDATRPRGRYLSGPVTWGGFDEERIENLSMDFEVVHTDTDQDLFAELEAAVGRREPIVLWVYAPHWVPVRHDGAWVDFPPYTRNCYASRRYSCAKPSGPIWKVAAADLERKWPTAAQAIRAFRMSNEDMGALIASVERDGASIEDAARSWLGKNEAVWKSWLD